MPAPLYTPAERAARRAANDRLYASGHAYNARPLCGTCADRAWLAGARTWCACAGAVWSAPAELVDLMDQLGTGYGWALAERLFALAVRGPRPVELPAPAPLRPAA